MQGYAYAILAAGWLFWSLPFLLHRQKAERPVTVDRRARWGILLVGVAYWSLWQGKFWEKPATGWRIVLSMLLFTLAALLSWSAKRALGRQWRFDAGLNSDHKLVLSGPYQIVRHPIYTSMLCILLGTGIIITSGWRLYLALSIFLVGTEIRVRLEDRLLDSRFGDEFRAYRQRVHSYVPFVR